MIEEREL